MVAMVPQCGHVYQQVVGKIYNVIKQVQHVSDNQYLSLAVNRATVTTEDGTVRGGCRLREGCCCGGGGSVVGGEGGGGRLRNGGCASSGNRFRRCCCIEAMDTCACSSTESTDPSPLDRLATRVGGGIRTVDVSDCCKSWSCLFFLSSSASVCSGIEDCD